MLFSGSEGKEKRWPGFWGESLSPGLTQTMLQR
jgi:hypothetical protein